MNCSPLFYNIRFQSTLPVWGATRFPLCKLPCRMYFNPRSPCGERRTSCGRNWPIRKFQSTLPVWGATKTGLNQFFVAWISIHAPRVGSDRPGPKDFGNHCDFNPRSPCGERRYHDNYLKDVTFISIHAPRVGSDRMLAGELDSSNTISIHAPRVGSDVADTTLSCVRH